MTADAETTPGHVRFATVCCIRLRPTEGGLIADVACGGHPLPVVVRSDGTTEECGIPGTLVGVFPRIEIKSDRTVLRPGDTIIAFTDGVIEARDADGNQFDVKGIREVVTPLAGRPAHELSGAIESAVLALQGGVSHDDVALLVVQATAEAHR